MYAMCVAYTSDLARKKDTHKYTRVFHMSY